MDWMYSKGLNDIVKNTIMPGIADNFSTSSRLTNLLMNDGKLTPIAGNTPRTKGGMIVGGDYLERPIDVAAHEAINWYKGLSPLKTTQNRMTNTTKQEWASLAATVVISRQDQLKARGDEAKIELVKYKIGKAYQALRSEIARSLYFCDAQLAGEDVMGVHGLGQLAGSSYPAGTMVGGINRTWQQLDSSVAGMEFWDCNSRDENSAEADLEDPTSDDHMPAILSRLDMDCRFLGQSVTHYLTTETLYLAYENIMRQKQQIVQSKTADLGFEYLTFRGKPVIYEESSHIPAGAIYALNLNDIDGDGPGIQIKGRKGNFFERDNWIPLSGQLGDECHISVEFCLWCDKPRYQGSAQNVGIN